jgi:hypothetical protein
MLQDAGVCSSLASPSVASTGTSIVGKPDKN